MASDVLAELRCQLGRARARWHYARRVIRTALSEKARRRNEAKVEREEERIIMLEQMISEEEERRKHAI
jgi:hypothetical protein